MTAKPAAKDILRERLARLEADQIADLVLDLQSRIDGLRAELSTVREPIAIVGQACRLPHADGIDDFRRLLFAGENAVGSPPASRPEAENLPPAGYIADIDRFDAGFFGFRANEAAAMDPQQRMLMELTWHGLEDAGYADRNWRPAHTGLFVGISTSDYEERFRGDGHRGFTPAAITGNARSIAAGRLAHWLDTTGPALALDTACSSSLVAVHIACLSLRSGACDMAIAAGVNALLEGDLSDGFEAAGMLSVDHACKTFDTGANGYVRGEGGGVVVLKRLSDAERDGDLIRAVIKGGAINHDGRASALTAPNGPAQVAVIRAALENAGLGPGDVQAVECHGTGTPLGDPIEVQALGEAYGPARESDLLIGAVKTNIGHLEAAAGIAGLIKMVLALETRRLPATIHQTSPNPRIAWDALPVRVIDSPIDWPACPTRRGGVSSFGFSGTNAHIILEAAPAVETPSKADSALTLLPLSAPDQEGVSRLAATLARAMESKPDVRPSDIAASLAIGRETFAERAGVGGADREALIDGLREIADGGGSAAGARGTAVAERPKVAFLFTGQGSQWSGMGRDLYDSDAGFKAIVDGCADVLEPYLPHPLVDLMFDEAHDDLLLDTAIAQPILFVLEYALAKRLEAWGIVPDIMIGHSLGELVAACLAGVMTRDDALRLTAERGRLMGSMPRGGAMAAVFAPLTAVEPLLAEHHGRVDIAAINGPEDTVISGDADAVDAICDALEAQDAGSQRLRVSHAFHSALMEPVLDTFREAVAGVSLSNPCLPVVSNVTATADAPFTDPAYWARHVREPVRFGDGVSALIDYGATVLVEIGATSALLGMAQRSLADNDTAVTFVPTLRRNKPASQGLGAALARLFVAGAPIDWPALIGEARRTALPGYPFADERHWTPRPARYAGVAEHPVADSSPTHSAEATSTVSPDELPDAVRTLLARSMQLEPTALETDAGLFELGVDSLALTEAIAAVERRWRITLARQAVFAAYNNARRLVAHVVDAVANQADAAPGDVTTEPVADRRAATPAPPFSPAVVQQPSLSETARAYLSGFARDYVERSAASRRQRETYEEVLADSRAVAGFRPETKAMLYPIVGAKGSGSHVVDLDGNDYVSLTMGFGVQLFGHNPPFVVDAMQRHLAEQGLFMGPQASLAGEVAERIARLTGDERVLFCNTGTEAVMTALRIARHATGRSLVAMFAGSYHGHFDGTLARSGPDGRGAALAGGTPDGMVKDMLVLDYADPEGSLEALKQVAGDLAAVIVEPVQSRRPSLQPRRFLQQLRVFTEEAGAALVFDDVLLGFRVAQGGSQAWADVRADLVTYGKILGGGLPIGVVTGRRAFLDAIDGGTWSFDGDDSPKEFRTFFAGTFNKNPLTMAASNAVLRHLEEAGPELQDNLNARTADFCARLNAVLGEEQTALRVDHFASVFRFNGASDLFFNHLIANGVYVWEGRTCFLSTAHTDADLERVEEAVRRSVRAMLPAGLMATRGPSEEVQRIATTPGQQALWVLAAFSQETSSAYNQSLVIDLDGDLDEAALTRALQTLCERHDSLRSSFSDDGERLTIHDAAPVDLEQVDIAGSDEATGEAWIKAAAAQPFDLEVGPLLRAALLRLSPGRHRLVLIQPHIVTDGWSMQVLAVELGELYSSFQAGREPALPPAPAYNVYAEHACAMADAPEAAAHWLGLYRTLPPTLDLPADRPRPRLQAYDGETVRRMISATLSERLEKRARDLGCSLFTLCLAGYARLLNALTGQDDLAVAVFAAGQPLVGERSLTGYCVATLPVRLRGAGTSSGRDLVARSQQAMADALAYPAYPFPALIKALGMKRDPSRPPLTGVSFNLDRLDAEPVFDGLTTTLDANAHGSVRWDLNWNMLASADGLRIDANFNTGLYDRERVEGWVTTYVGILEGLCDATDDATRPAPPDDPDFETLAHRVTTWAATTPHAIAVLDHQGATEYAALDRLAAALAGRLTAARIERGDRVAFKLDRGLGPVVAMLAAARIGAPFVPLDPEHPADHHAYILRDSGARVLITEEADDATFDLPTIGLRTNDDDVPSDLPGPCGVAPGDLAYVLYTSGSTGRPKGVMVPWRAVETYGAALLARLGVATPTSFAIVTSFAADLGYTSVLGALRSGGTLHAIDAETARDPNRLIAWFQDHPVDMMKIVPTHMAALMTAPDAATLVPRSALIFGGDVLTYDLVDRVRALRGACRIFNHYGPTETTIGATMIEVTGELRQPGDTAVPIGRPLDGYTIEVVDEDGGPVDDNVTGELRIAGPPVATGYVTPHGHERARFSRGADGIARYATGDLGCRRRDGIIEFAGRKDDVVKIRGHQVDPAGIATLLRAHPRVHDAAVLVDRQDNRGPRLVAAVVSDASTESIAAWLSERVPAAMCPSRLIALDAIPLNANGKVDRAVLLATLDRPSRQATAPTRSNGDRVDIMRTIWREVLEIEHIGANDDFFALGGDSIIAIRIAGKARSVGLTISPSQIFEHATPASLAAAAVTVDERAPGIRERVDDAVPLTPIQRWFMAIAMARRNHWALTAVFDVAPETTPAQIEEALSVLVERHDALGTALRQTGGKDTQELVGEPTKPPVIVHKMHGSDDVAPRKAEDDLADRLIAGLDLKHGRVIAGGLITSPSGAVRRLVVTAHHFAFDMVSWGIVAEDIGAALAKGTDAVAPVATPWTWWCSQLAAYAEAARPQLSYWQSVEANGSTAIPLDQPDGANSEGDAQEIERPIDAAVTQALLTSSAEIYGMQAHEVVLAALGRALVRWTGASTIVELEGHGREPLDPTIDLSRTVGWFTTRYPLALPHDQAGEPRHWLVAVKEALRGTPQRGMGYGLLRYVDGAGLTCRPTVSYNFVGEISRYGGDLGLVRLGAGHERDPAAERPHDLVFTAWLDNGALCLRGQHAGKHTTATVTALLDDIAGEVALLAEHCATASGRVYTPGDFADLSFSQDELDQLTAEVLGSD